MKIGNCSATIEGGREQASGHVAMKHGQTYKITMSNSDMDRRCDAEVVIDGKPVGCWRVRYGGSVTIERPANEARLLTFFEAGTPEAVAGQINANASQMGLVQVTFRFEKLLQRPFRTAVVASASCDVSPAVAGGSSVRGVERYMSAKGAEVRPGGTALTGHSDQEFSTVAHLDYSDEPPTVVTLRLVSDQQPAISPLRPASVSNPVPAPV